jgi:hypothetical protein
MPTFDERTQAAIRSTDRELMDFVFDEESDTEEEADASQDIIEANSMAPGWNGDVDDAEAIAELQGAADPNDLVGQPLALSHAREVEALKQQHAQELQGRDTYIQTLQQQYNPEIQSQREQQRWNYWDAVGAVPVDTTKSDQFIGSVQQVVNENQMLKYQIGEAKLQKAAEEFGEEYTRAYDTLRAARDTPAGRHR